MIFQPGTKKLPNSGRKKGVKNKKKVPKVADYLAQEGISPAEEIIKIIRRGRLDDKEQISAWVDLLSYTQSKPGPETDGEADNDNDLLELYKDVSDGNIIQMFKEKNEA